MHTSVRTPAVKTSLPQSHDRDRKQINQAVSTTQRRVILKWYGFFCFFFLLHRYKKKVKDKQHLTFLLWNATGHTKPNQPYVKQLLLLQVKEPNLS